MLPLRLDVNAGNWRAFEGLLDYDVNLELVPRLATSMPEVSADGLVVTVAIRDDVVFHDDEPLTATDVVYTFTTVSDPNFGSPVLDAWGFRDLFESIEGGETWGRQSIIGLPAALALGLMAGLLAFVPYVGPVMAYIPALAVGFTANKVVAVTQTSVFLGMKAAGEALKASGHGSVVNISSMYGIVGSGVSPAYHAAKGAVRLLTKTTALGWAEAGVRVNSVHPGYIDTPILGDTDRQYLIDTTPMGRLGEPEEIANVIAFLASDESSFMTGSEVVADGGYTAG